MSAATSKSGASAFSVLGVGLLTYGVFHLSGVSINAPGSKSYGPSGSIVTINHEDPEVASQLGEINQHITQHDGTLADHDEQLADNRQRIRDEAVQRAALQEYVEKCLPKPKTSTPIPGWNGDINLVTDRKQDLGSAPKLLMKCGDFPIDGQLVHGNLYRTRNGRFVLLKHRRNDL